MRPERAVAMVERWVRFYTRGLPTPFADRRIREVTADLHDHVVDERARGVGARRISLSIGSRALRGLAADVTWRLHTRKGQLMKSQSPVVPIGLGLLAAVVTTLVVMVFLGGGAPIIGLVVGVVVALVYAKRRKRIGERG